MGSGGTLEMAWPRANYSRLPGFRAARALVCVASGAEDSAQGLEGGFNPRLSNRSHCQVDAGRCGDRVGTRVFGQQRPTQVRSAVAVQPVWL